MPFPAVTSPDSDNALLEQFVVCGSQSAFREIVERHAPLVLAVARRQTGDEEAARDVAQNVFALLARKAPELRRHPSLAGWIFTVCRLESLASRRREQRRARFMKSYAEDAATRQEPPIPAPLLDEALEQMPEQDRELLLARYYQGAAFSDIAQARRISEPAVRKQVSRALERLAALLARRGVAASVSTLSPSLASAFTCPEVPCRMLEHLTESAIHSGRIQATAQLATFMTAKTTLITGAALIWLASLAGGWQAGLQSAPHAVSLPQVPPNLSAPPPTGPLAKRPPTANPAGPRAQALRELIARIAEDLEAAEWDSTAKWRAHARLASLSNADAAEAIAVAMMLTDPPSKLLDILWSRRGRVEGPLALEAAAAFPPGRRAGARLNALCGWALTDPPAALRWAQTQPQPIPEELDVVIAAWSSSDAPAALAAVRDLPLSDQKTDLLMTYCRNARETDAATRQALTEAILAAPDNNRAGLLNDAARQWQDQPAAYAAWLAEHGMIEKYGATALEGLCRTWAESDPLAAAQWLRETMNGQSGYPYLLREVVYPWAMKDAPSASEWLAAQPAGPELDEAIASFIGTLPPNENEAVRAWADRLQDRSRAAALLEQRRFKPLP